VFSLPVKAPLDQVTHTVFLEFSKHDIVSMGKVVIGLFGKTVPILTENFRAICEGKYLSFINGKELTYQNSPVT